AGGNLRSVSYDGRYVLFTSEGQANGVQDLVTGVAVNPTQSHAYLRDRQTGVTQILDVAPDGLTAPGGADAIMTPDARYVAFSSSQGPLLVPDVAYNADPLRSDVFIRDRQTGTTSLISVDPAGTHGNATELAGSEIALSDDGNYVAFTST